MKCPKCDAANADGLLCATCTTALDTDLATIANDWPELETTIRRQAKTGPNGATTIASNTTPLNLTALEIRDNAATTLANWAVIIGRQTPQATPTTPTTVDWLRHHISDIRPHPQAPDICRDIWATRRTIRWIIDRHDRQYLGEHNCPDGHSGAIIATTTTSPTAHCDRCHTHLDATALRHQRTHDSDDYLVTQTELATIYPRRTITRWIKDGRLTIKGSVNGQSAYRLGDARILRQHADTAHTS